MKNNAKFDAMSQNIFLTKKKVIKQLILSTLTINIITWTGRAHNSK